MAAREWQLLRASTLPDPLRVRLICLRDLLEFAVRSMDSKSRRLSLHRCRDLKRWLGHSEQNAADG